MSVPPPSTSPPGASSGPSPLGPPAERLLALLRSVTAQPAKREFLGAVDALRDDAHGALEAAYGDAYYAKLLYLKATNFLVSGYHLACGHTSLASQPVTLMVDPANSCQLRCPGCVHSGNERFVDGLSWPNGVMHQDAFERLLERCGPFATNSVLYNYGEPLLNKKLPALIRRARGYGMTTHLSTNLSMKFDVEDFVRAQPDHIILSIDGITQETYGRFRKRGNLELVLENVRAMVQAKQRLGLNRPILVWRFFPFEHNVHEVDDALALAESMGVDEMIIGNPFDVSADDPDVRLVECDRKGRYKFTREALLERSPQQILEGLERNPELDRLFERGWLARLSAEELDEPARRADNACRWLHYSMTLDAVGRVMPCCISPSRSKDLVYGDLADDEDWWNGERFAEARLSLVDPAAYQAGRPAKSAGAADTTASPPGEPYCSTCPRRPAMTYSPPNAWKDLCGLDFKQVALNPGEREWWQFAEAGG